MKFNKNLEYVYVVYKDYAEAGPCPGDIPSDKLQRHSIRELQEQVKFLSNPFIKSFIYIEDGYAYYHHADVINELMVERSSRFAERFKVVSLSELMLYTVLDYALLFNTDVKNNSYYEPAIRPYQLLLLPK